jgi:hypothetical protein
LLPLKLLLENKLLDLTQSLLKEIFSYHPDGYLIRNRSGVAVEPKITKHHRYARVVIKNKPYAMHRIIFLWHHGFLPKVIDHADNDRLNNRIENLREATHQQNAMNKKRDCNSRSPYKGVTPSSRPRKDGLFSWEVRVSVSGKQVHLGTFNDIEVANQVAVLAREKYHGQFARHA